MMQDGKFSKPVAAMEGYDTYLNGINDAGQAVGWVTDWSTFTYAFVREPSWKLQFIDMWKVGERFHDINNVGQIIGFCVDNYVFDGYLYDRGEALLIDMPGAIGMLLNGINDGGVYVGYYWDKEANHGVLYR
jgi:hypothetical protein